MLVGGKLVAAVASTDCKIMGVMIIVMRAMTTGYKLEIQCWLILHSCHLLLNIILLTPALVFSTRINMDRFLA